VADAMKQILVAQHCLVIRSDNGSEFTANEFKAMTTEHGIKHVFSDMYNPKQNVMIKCFNKTLKMAVYQYSGIYRKLAMQTCKK
jgi:transposase InsO family protein